MYVFLFKFFNIALFMYQLALQIKEIWHKSMTSYKLN